MRAKKILKVNTTTRKTKPNVGISGTLSWSGRQWERSEIATVVCLNRMYHQLQGLWVSNSSEVIELAVRISAMAKLVFSDAEAGGECVNLRRFDGGE